MLKGGSVIQEYSSELKKKHFIETYPASLKWYDILNFSITECYRKSLYSHKTTHIRWLKLTKMNFYGQVPGISVTLKISFIYLLSIDIYEAVPQCEVTGGCR